jgi:hypothetical protein
MICSNVCGERISSPRQHSTCKCIANQDSTIVRIAFFDRRTVVRVAEFRCDEAVIGDLARETSGHRTPYG